ncbi:serine hydrolase [Oesophagostomum dentatum]|uniref:Serine hydrolase n=1 Tax=Oesophagostomum dentatum TaxID=61180 RepID=A0A0B1T383_OESDE|nr:serine hydrolase [Oesophagostomum dentatum]
MHNFDRPRSCEMTATKKLRILCLHGYRQNDVLFREKTGSLRKQFRKYAEFEFMSAPLVPNVDSEDRGDVRGWWFSREDNQFSSRDICSIATGFEQSACAGHGRSKRDAKVGPNISKNGLQAGKKMKGVAAVSDYVHTNGPFDGILGFSQGASMAHLLMGNCISEDAQRGHKDFLKNVKSDPEKQVTSFRVYLHRRNKFIHAWLRISADDVTLERSKTDVVVWPLQFLRRYGYTSAGTFILNLRYWHFLQLRLFSSYNRGFKTMQTLITPKRCGVMKEPEAQAQLWEQEYHCVVSTPYNDMGVKKPRFMLTKRTHSLVSR